MPREPRCRCGTCRTCKNRTRQRVYRAKTRPRPQPPTGYIPLRQAVREAYYSRVALWKKIQAGALPAVKLRNRWYVERAALSGLH